MSSEILSNLLAEYEQKKRNAELDSENRKTELYKKIPRLQEIEEELNSFAINTAKKILNGTSNSLEELNEKIHKLENEKQEIYKTNNISIEYLKPNYHCKICNDSGYVQLAEGSILCSCLKQKLLDISYNKSNMSNLSKENFDSFNPNIFSDKSNVEKYKLNISPRENILIIKEKCIEFVNNFDNPEYRNLLFTGNTGLGKTFMTNCIANELIKNRKKCSVSNSTSFIRNCY